MISHVIPPSWGYTKVSNSLVRQPRLGSDAKILIMYVQGLPEGDRDKALGEHARELRIGGRRYQKAKAELIASGYVHERREAASGGRWRTVQVFSNCPLTDDQVARLRAGVPADGYEVLSTGPAPSAQSPAVGAPTGRVVGGQLPADEEPGKNDSHPPTEAREGSGEGSGTPSAEPAGESVGELAGELADGPSRTDSDAASRTAEVVAAERVLLSLRH